MPETLPQPEGAGTTTPPIDDDLPKTSEPAVAGADLLAGLSVRAAKAILVWVSPGGLVGLADIKQRIASGDLEPIRWRGVGPATHMEILRWSKRPICPCCGQLVPVNEPGQERCNDQNV